MNAARALLASLALMTVGCSPAEEGPGSEPPEASEKAKPTACVYKTRHRRACSPDYPRSFNEDYTETKCSDSTSCNIREPRSRRVGGCVTAEEDFDEGLVEGTCEWLGLGHVCDSIEANERFLARWACAETTCADELAACRDADACISRVLCMEDCSLPASGEPYDTCVEGCTTKRGAETEEALEGVRTCLGDSSCRTLCGRTDYSL